jgi:hypothetical protein
VAVGRSLPEEPVRQSLGARTREVLRQPCVRSSTGNCHPTLAFAPGSADARYSSRNLVEDRRQESRRWRRVRETSPCSETPLTKSSCPSILPHPIRSFVDWSFVEFRDEITPPLLGTSTKPPAVGSLRRSASSDSNAEVDAIRVQPASLPISTLASWAGRRTEAFGLGRYSRSSTVF